MACIIQMGSTQYLERHILYWMGPRTCLCARTHLYLVLYWFLTRIAVIGWWMCWCTPSLSVHLWYVISAYDCLSWLFRPGAGPLYLVTFNWRHVSTSGPRVVTVSIRAAFNTRLWRDINLPKIPILGKKVSNINIATEINKQSGQRPTWNNPQ